MVPRTVAQLTLRKVEALPDDDGSGDCYRIEWSASPAGSLTLHGASGGIGDRVPGEETLTFQSPTFGACRVEVDGADLATGWMSEMESGLPAYSLVGQGVPREHFLEVARSLDYLKL